MNIQVNVNLDDRTSLIYDLGDRGLVVAVYGMIVKTDIYEYYNTGVDGTKLVVYDIIHRMDIFNHILQLLIKNMTKDEVIFSGITDVISPYNSVFNELGISNNQSVLTTKQIKKACFINESFRDFIKLDENKIEVDYIIKCEVGGDYVYESLPLWFKSQGLNTVVNERISCSGRGEDEGYPVVSIVINKYGKYIPVITYMTHNKYNATDILGCSTKLSNINYLIDYDINKHHKYLIAVTNYNTSETDMRLKIVLREFKNIEEDIGYNTLTQARMKIMKTFDDVLYSMWNMSCKSTDIIGAIMSRSEVTLGDMRYKLGLDLYPNIVYAVYMTNDEYECQKDIDDVMNYLSYKLSTCKYFETDVVVCCDSITILKDDDYEQLIESEYIVIQNV